MLSFLNSTYKMGFVKDRSTLPALATLFAPIFPRGLANNNKLSNRNVNLFQARQHDMIIISGVNDQQLTVSAETARHTQSTHQAERYDPGIFAGLQVLAQNFIAKIILFTKILTPIRRLQAVVATLLSVQRKARVPDGLCPQTLPGFCTSRLRQSGLAQSACAVHQQAWRLPLLRAHSQSVSPNCRSNL